MRIPSWAFTNLGQHLMDTKTDEFEIVDIDIPIVEIPIVEIPIVEIQKVEIPIVEIPIVEIPIFDETLQDAFVSMFENIAWYIYTKNNITSILAELYT